MTWQIDCLRVRKYLYAKKDVPVGMSFLLQPAAGRVQMAFFSGMFRQSCFNSAISLTPSLKPCLYASAPYAAPHSLAVEMAWSASLFCSSSSPAFSNSSHAVSCLSCADWNSASSSSAFSKALWILSSASMPNSFSFSMPISSLFYFCSLYHAVIMLSINILPSF